MNVLRELNILWESQSGMKSALSHPGRDNLLLLLLFFLAYLVGESLKE